VRFDVWRLIWQETLLGISESGRFVMALRAIESETDVQALVEVRPKHEHYAIAPCEG
jgi:hypothetical protein